MGLVPFLKRKRPELAHSLPSEDTARRQPLTGKKRALSGTKSASTLILYFQPPELRNKCLFKPLVYGILL